MSTNNEGTPTPLTDAQMPVEIYDEAGQQYDSTLVDRDFARQLERDLTATKQRLEVAEKALRIIVEALTEYDAETVGDRATVEMHAKDVEQLRAALHPSAYKPHGFNPREFLANQENTPPDIETAIGKNLFDLIDGSPSADKAESNK